MQPIYGTTLSGTETIFDHWMNGEKDKAIKLLIDCIRVNRPETQLNNEQMAKGTIEQWLEDNF